MRGNILVESIKSFRLFFPLNTYLARAYPPGIPSIKLNTIVSTATYILISIDFPAPKVTNSL